jgi:hypothetical protein
LWSSLLKAKNVAVLLCLTGGAFLLHGYHPGAEDAEIYLPGILKDLHPNLFPFNGEFFANHAHMTIFPDLIAYSARLLPLPFDWVLVLWQLTSIFLLLAACWKLSGKCFSNPSARWAGVALIAALLTLPVAGTALYIVDQYVNPRNLAAFAAIFAIAYMLEKKYLWAALWIVFAFAVHPLMAFFAFSFCVLMLAMRTFGNRLEAPLFAGLLAGSFFVPPVSEAYHEAALYHSFHYIQRWAWYEWLGILAPIPILWWFSRIAKTRQTEDLDRMCRGLIIYDLIYFAAALIFDLPARFEGLARLQPLRSLHLLYILLFLFSGCFLGEYALKKHVWRWALLFVPLCLGMFAAQLALFPVSQHIEWTRTSSPNPWAEAFVWIRENTSPQAIVALDPFYMHIPGEDSQGFRAIAERSRLADASKDSGAVTMFPPLADEWYAQMQAQKGWKNFQRADFERLRSRYGVEWVVVQQPGAPGMFCSFQNSAVKICRLD